jgi:hypothetical protein
MARWVNTSTRFVRSGGVRMSTPHPTKEVWLNVRRLRKLGTPLDIIAKATNLDIDVVRSLARAIKYRKSKVPKVKPSPKEPTKEENIAKFYEYMRRTYPWIKFGPTQ